MAVSRLFPSSLLGGSGNKASPGRQKEGLFPAKAGHGWPWPENVPPFGVLVEPASEAWLLYKRETAMCPPLATPGGLVQAGPLLVLQLPLDLWGLSLEVA